MKVISLFLVTVLGSLYFVFDHMTDGKGVPQEGLIILMHYALGDGEDLVLESSYFPESPVIQKELSKMKVGDSKKVKLRQHEDWRLSYALNGFTLTKNEDGFSIFQHIVFDKTGKVYTNVRTPFGNIRIYDNDVHKVISCIPFDVHYRYHSK